MSKLSVHHLSKSYRSREVVSDVSLVVENGEIIVVEKNNFLGITYFLFFLSSWLDYRIF